MAARKMTKLHQDDVRSKIQCSQLINVLTNHALGKSEDLTMSRIKSIEILLRKSMADLSAIDLSGSVSVGVTIQATQHDESL
jgi:hypothetical protein